MLDPIVSSVRARLGETIERAGQWRRDSLAAEPPRDFAGALAAPGLSVIAEIKRRSPSAGPIDLDLDPASQASAYESGGASAMSVLTEPDHFGGSLADLGAVRGAVAIPVLRKDFMLHEAQIWQARAAGADAILLIAAILDDDTLASLMGVAAIAGVAALVEVHTAVEARRVADLDPAIVGVNNRDLTTFRVNLATAETLRPLLPAGAICVGESGVSSPVGAARMAAAGYDAILVGEVAVRSADPSAFIASLKEAGP
ncbi:indole-3-glycerol-phosphate synthase [bacterium]|nr:indole-3-glycerol-phosphate synthase [bacterium]